MDANQNEDVKVGTIELKDVKQRKARKTEEQIKADEEKYGYVPKSWMEKDMISNKIKTIMKENPDMDQKQAIAMAYSYVRKLMSPSRYIPNFAFKKG